VNQDRYFNNPFFCDNNTIHLFGVCDGHGSTGHLISQAISDLVPLKLSEEIKWWGPDVSTSEKVRSGILSARLLLMELGIDAWFSGTTLNLCLFKDNKIFCANIGDSRTVLCTKSH